jgi:hypothetical protein
MVKCLNEGAIARQRRVKKLQAVCLLLSVIGDTREYIIPAQSLI